MIFIVGFVGKRHCRVLPKIGERFFEGRSPSEKIEINQDLTVGGLTAVISE